jgi:hypothetical protein
VTTNFQLINIILIISIIIIIKYDGEAKVSWFLSWEYFEIISCLLAQCGNMSRSNLGKYSRSCLCVSQDSHLYRCHSIPRTIALKVIE